MATRGVLPLDLPKVDLARVPTSTPRLASPWPGRSPASPARLTIGLTAYTEPVLRAALAITLIEQPYKVPCNNAVGLMPWGKRFLGLGPGLLAQAPQRLLPGQRRLRLRHDGHLLRLRHYADSFRFLRSRAQARNPRRRRLRRPLGRRPVPRRPRQASSTKAWKGQRPLAGIGRTCFIGPIPGAVERHLALAARARSRAPRAASL